MIPFNYCVPKDKMDKHLQDKLMAEAEEILTWAIEGTNIWEKEGLGEAEAVTLATNEYRSESDAIGLFLKEKTEKDLSSYYFKRDLFHRYKLWAEDAGEYLLSERYFNNAMKERGYQTAKRGQGGRVCWLGIKAKNQNEKQEEIYHEEEFD